METRQEAHILSLRHITKKYPGVTALQDVSVDFRRGEVHALVGENGAGKSTLIKTISGAIEPTQGSILYEGTAYSKMDPIEARRMGIEVVYQEFNLAPSLSVAENIYLGNPIMKGLLVDRDRMNLEARKLMKSLNIDIDPTVKVRDLTVAYMQLVEIAKAISHEAKVLIMDEPSATLTNTEVEILFSLIGRLKAQGVLIIYVSHRMEEIFRVCDRITVMRDGCRITTLEASQTNRQELIRHMVGRELRETYPSRSSAVGDVVLEIRDLCGPGVDPVSFSVRAGEVLGLGGLVGAGRTELARLIFGADRKSSGAVLIDGRELEIRSPEDAIAGGIGLIPEDRKAQGVILEKSIEWNITLAIFRRLARWNLIDRKGERRISAGYGESLRIKTPSLEQHVKNLSGGNQQKVVLAKWMATDSRVLIFDEPTRGIDVGAKQEIYRLINDLCAQGKAIVMISSEMEELLGMSDRLVVLSEGRFVGTLERDGFSQDTVLDMASGQH